MDIHKAEIFGKGYIIDEIIYNLMEKMEHKRDNKRIIGYVCKSLQLIPQGKYLSEDIYSIFENKPKSERTAQEIVDEVVKKAGLVRLNNGN